MPSPFTPESFKKPTIQTVSGESIPVGMIYCIGRNYIKHIEELNSKDLGEPVIFTKPSGAVCQGLDRIPLPVQSQDVHHEVELAIVIGKEGKNISREEVPQTIFGAAVALDLTMRDLQSKAKKNGTPWALAKGFDYSCPISKIYPGIDIETLSQVELLLKKNGGTVQQGNTRNMMYKIDWLVSYLSDYFTLKPGDIVLTGTPEGVGPVRSGDELEFSASFTELNRVSFF